MFEIPSLRYKGVGTNEHEVGLITDVDGRGENVCDKIEDVHGRTDNVRGGNEKLGGLM